MTHSAADHAPHQPPADCPLCPRLAAFREANREAFPAFFNAPVPSFGPLEAPLLVVGLAPGLKGANATGRPFTGDYAGEVLYPALLRFGLAEGTYRADPKDHTTLLNVRITNAVRCVPPENKPTPAEEKTCNRFLKAELAAMPNLSMILTLGGISHAAVLVALGQKKSAFKFGHGNRHTLRSAAHGREVTILNSYHTSRYNVNTGRLTFAMFDGIVQTLAAHVKERKAA